MSATPPVRQPLFYVDPQPLLSTDHAAWRLRDGNIAFASDALGIPVVLGEFADAARCYAILFAAGEEGGPVILTGVDNNNQFMADGYWDATTYVPAYVRRHPFGLINMGTVTEGQPDLALAIDVASPRFAREGEEGVALFEAGEPSQLTRDAMQFCTAYSGEAGVTVEFCKALRAKGLMMSRRLDGTLPDGKKVTVDGFEVIDVQKLTDLDAETIVEWHRKGWMAAAYYHLASLSRVGDLMERRAKSGPAKTA